MSSTAALEALLHAGEELSPARCADLLGVGDRQARRVMDDLMKRLPVQKQKVGKEVFYVLPEESRVVEDDPLHLGERERLALHVALQAGGSVLRGTPLATGLDAVQQRLRAGNPLHFDLVYHVWHFQGAGEANLDAAVFDVLLEALRDARALRLDYTNAQGSRSPDRRVDPYTLASRNGSWLLVGRDEKSGEVRSFALPAIAAARVDEAPANRPEGFDPAMYFRDAFGAFTGGGVEVVRLVVDGSAATSFRRKQYHPTQQIEEEHADGRIVVSFEAEGMESVASFVRSFGPCVEVLAPASLREEVAADARATARLYGGA